MTATANRPSRRSRSRAPPPTPIKTAKGFRSAAIDDRVLAEFLESSLQVPNLLLRRSSSSIGEEIDFAALVARDEAAVRRLLAAANQVGALRIGGGDYLPMEELRSAIEVGGGVFGIPEERKREMGRCFGRRDGISERFFWCRMASSETHRSYRVLEEALPDTYQILRENMENIAVKMETVAECIATILSKNVKKQSHSMPFNKATSILCLTKYDSGNLQGNQSKFDAADTPQSYALTLHLSGCDEEFCLRTPECSTSFKVSAGSTLVTIGKQFQDWSNGELKNAMGEMLINMARKSTPLITMEFFYSTESLYHELDNEKKTVSLLYQLLIVVVLLTFYRIWFG
ncbi:uncharacterized protein [Typha latifolia]|uniref:uncharacterized protein isoform X1 n=1 Tax=Typha latifolia TaxID=4733 RepID=UPI003C30267D